MIEIKFKQFEELVNDDKLHIQTGPFGTQLKASDYVSEGTPVINVRNIGYGIEKESTLEYLNESKTDKLKQHILKEGDIVFGRKGAVDRHLLCKHKHNGWIQGSDCIRVRFKTNELNSTFISYYFLTEGHKQWMEAQGSFGATMGSLNQGIINRISYPNIPLPIQRKIAAVLSAYDDLIENNNRRITILETMAEELYREWFVRLRFPGHDGGAGFKPAPTKGVPEGWEVKKIGEILSYYIGGGWGEENKNINFPKEAYVIRGTDIPNLSKGSFLDIPFRFHKESNYKSRELIEGDIVFEVSGGSKNQLLGRSILITKGILDTYNNVICASFCKLLRPNISSYYLSYYLKAYYDCGNVGIFQIQSTGISNYQFEAFLKYQTILIPSDYTLNLFDQKISDIIKQRDNLAIKNNLLKSSKNSLLARLMSGKIDVENLDIHFPESMQEEIASEAKK